MLYILNICGSNDMHCENIIAYKGYPVIVDYETIIGNYDYNKNATNAYDEFVKKFSSSVINIGFLPVEIRGLLLGGLNNQGGTQSIEHEAIICKDDESILFEKQRFELKSNKNIPILDNEYQEYYDYISDILSGFEKAFRIFYCNKEIINELKVTFSGSQARVVLQATQNYVDIAEFSSHPNYLYDMLDLEKLFENVINSFFDVTGHFLSEINDMINGDIPIFYANANEKTLIDSTGMRIEDFFSNTIIERIESKTEELAGIYEEQKKYLLYYFGCGQLTNKQFWDTQYLTVKNEEVTNADNLLLFLEKRIEKNIILAKNEETLTWLTMENNNLTCVFSDVYEGFGGLAWYIINAKKMNYKNSVLDKYEKVIEKMLLNKYTFWGDESLGVCRTAGNEIGLLISFYKFDKDVRFEEKIAVLLEFIKANMNSNQIKLSVLEVAQMINVLFEVYDALDNYEALLLMNNLGEYMLRELKKYGYIHMFGEEVFHIGTVINALKVMSDVTENEVYRYEYNDIMEEFLSGTLNDNQYNVMEYSYNICSGELLRVLESLMMIGDKKYYSNLIELCQSISEKALDITFDNDTLYEGTCAALSLAIQINDKAKVKYYLETLFNRYKIYNDIKVVDAPIFPKLGLKNGYLGVAYAVMRGISFINNGENK